MPRLRPRLRRLLLRGAAALLVAVGVSSGVVAALWVTLPDPAPLARENPRTTALIEQRRAEAKARKRAFRPRQSWIPLERVSRRFQEAVILSEDANFFGHEGIDWDAMREAAEHDLARGRFARGASTITQQLAKNLWFGTEKSLWRKAKEAVLAAKLERAASKRRILALYVNVAEWGDGVFGIEAGSRFRFGTSAQGLSTAQAVVMASLLPAPLRVDLGHPSTWLKRRARRLLDRMRAAGRIDAGEHRHASAELERILAGPAPKEDREEPPEDEPPAADAPGVADAEPPGAAIPASAAEPGTPAPAAEERPGAARPRPEDPPAAESAPPAADEPRDAQRL
jgi:monofunctional glycosyltransferase